MPLHAYFCLNPDGKQGSCPHLQDTGPHALMCPSPACPFPCARAMYPHHHLLTLHQWWLMRFQAMGQSSQRDQPRHLLAPGHIHSGSSENKKSLPLGKLTPIPPEVSRNTSFLLIFSAPVKAMNQRSSLPNLIYKDKTILCCSKAKHSLTPQCAKCFRPQTSVTQALSTNSASPRCPHSKV